MLCFLERGLARRQPRQRRSGISIPVIGAVELCCRAKKPAGTAAPRSTSASAPHGRSATRSTRPASPHGTNCRFGGLGCARTLYTVLLCIESVGGVDLQSRTQPLVDQTQKFYCSRGLAAQTCSMTTRCPEKCSWEESHNADEQKTPRSRCGLCKLTRPYQSNVSCRASFGVDSLSSHGLATAPLSPEWRSWSGRRAVSEDEIDVAAGCGVVSVIQFYSRNIVLNAYSIMKSVQMSLGSAEHLQPPRQLLTKILTSATFVPFDGFWGE